MIITVVYNYSFARLIFASGLDRRLPQVVSNVNAQPAPDVALWIQTLLASLVVGALLYLLGAGRRKGPA
ncbi:hypothetical protein ACIBO2_43225 [Nonomuraea sp. NPDC050022]|uniref:hypothetical protein n=1 Tax=Nonomuraea sp. NPDC050022 TaxID=3364358 RepID=UPI0037A2F11D